MQKTSMDSKANKITEVVRLQQMLKKWKKLTVASKSSSSSRGMKLLKRTMSFSDTSAATAAEEVVPKGCLAVCVGEEMQRFVIPTEYLGHGAFAALLREAEEEFGFQQEGVLRLPCEVSVFESALKTMEKNKGGRRHCSSEAEASRSHHPPKPVYR